MRRHINYDIIGFEILADYPLISKPNNTPSVGEVTQRIWIDTVKSWRQL